MLLRRYSYASPKNCAKRGETNYQRYKRATPLTHGPSFSWLTDKQARGTQKQNTAEEEASQGQYAPKANAYPRLIRTCDRNMVSGGAFPSCCCRKATAYSSRMFRSLRIALPVTQQQKNKQAWSGRAIRSPMPPRAKTAAA